MPELGESVHEGEVTRWLKKVGEKIKEDEPVVEIMTDKVNQELQAPASGILVKIIIPEGGTVEVFAAMGVIEEDEAKAKEMIAAAQAEAPAEEAAPAPEPKAPKVEAPAPAPKAPEKPVPAPAPAPTVSAEQIPGKRFYTPIVRVMAKDHGISLGELGTIHGSGKDGRVTKKDLEAYLASKGGRSIPGPLTADFTQKTDASGPETETVKLAGMRKMIADHMQRSSEIPVVTTLIDVDVTNVVNFRKENKEAFQHTHGLKLTFTPFFIKAAAEALVEFPMVNSSLEGKEITVNNRVHMGIAVSLGKDGSGGLIVPVMRNCESKSFVDIAGDLAEIATKARNNTLDTSDVQGATFTLTNPGSYGAALGTPMISAPQAGILGTYGIKQQPVVINGMIAIRSVMNLVLTYDHRLVDGATAGKFLQAMKRKLEDLSFFE